MQLPATYFWNKAPFVRLLVALTGGIIAQWYLQLAFSTLLAMIAAGFLLLAIFFFATLKSRFRFSPINGISINLTIAAMGGFLVEIHDVRTNDNGINKNYTAGNYVIATIEEPLVEKTNSFKSLARVNWIYRGNRFHNCDGRIIVYFRKDSFLKQMQYGSQIVFSNPLQEIRNPGNPGSFDYRQYCLFKGITHQVYLSKNDFELLPAKKTNRLNEFIYRCRNSVVHTLQSFISGKKEQGLAEALLIGYKDDLDKDLVQAYTNTGVVHIIAISGMHLALIYGLLMLLTLPFRSKKSWWLRVTLVLAGLWLFTLLAGAQASVVRAAVMFTCIAFGEALSKKASIYNTLSLSAFLLLAYDPFWLWDVGFQLSYAAVVSIVAFYRPIYNWFYFPNKSLDFVWKTMAISIAAQIFTTPVSLFHFHQFPVLFLLTNIVAVPLSGLILFTEIFICATAWLSPVAQLSGKLAGLLIYWMNSYIERLESVSFSLWSGFSINTIQTVSLLVAIASLCFWLTDKKKWTLWLALCSTILFVSIRSTSFFAAGAQRMLIVYNVPKHAAIDLVSGRNFSFIGDSVFIYDDFKRNFHIQPSRTLHRITQKQNLPVDCKDFEFANKKIAIIDSSTNFTSFEKKAAIDILILSKNPKLYITSLLTTFTISQIVIDGSVPAWKATLWKRDCDSLHIPCFDVSEKGAFVMNL